MRNFTKLKMGTGKKPVQAKPGPKSQPVATETEAPKDEPTSEEKVTKKTRKKAEDK